MATDVIMPQMGESIFEGTITKWLKKAGDAVQKDEPLFEISTDKVDAEIPSPVAGILCEIKVPAGETVQINTVVAVVTDTCDAVDASLSAAISSLPPQAGLAPTQVAQVAGGAEVVMPQMGESIFEGTITKWLKKAGDHVEKDEPLFEISTDKVDAEIPSPMAGILTQIKTPAGETVQINTVVAVIGGTVHAAAAPVATTPVQPAPVSIEQASITPSVSIDPGRRLRSSPLVRRIAQENKLDMTLVPGSGSDGRITKDDILSYLSQYGPGSETPTQSAPVLAKPQVSQVPTSQVSQGSAPQTPGQAVPLTRMRAIIAQRMIESKRTAAHAHSVYKIDMTRIVRLREREKGKYEQRNGVKLTYMPFIAAAVVETLGKFPILNASLVNGSIHYHRNVHLGIAVALEWGLIVPVIKQAEDRSFLGLARAIVDLADRARTKKLLPDEAFGSTFTLTNSGVFGGEFGTPVINQPESAILAIGGLQKEPIVLTDAEGNDTIAIRSMQHFCLGFDHRTIDGADAGKFMATLKKALETWDKEIG
jgi:2-oxoglutarate dehydrogenase E2 component (dihydrolipoamide succinyltransferase)